MPVELRKRKAPAPPPEPPAKKQTKAKVAKAVAKVKDVVAKPRGRPAKAKPAPAPEPAAEPVPAPEPAPAAAAVAAPNGAPAGKPAVGDVITLHGFGGDIETNDGDATTLKDLVEQSKAGVVLFTYPKASTPGCTRQACLFRDSYAPLTAGGLSIYGLSTDSPKANTTFKDKQKLPYPLLCDPKATLIGAIGLKKAPKGTTRGVFVIDKAGKVLAAEAGGPEATVTVVKRIVADFAGPEAAAEVAEPAAEPEDVKEAEAAPAEETTPEAPATEKAEEEAVAAPAKAEEEKADAPATNGEAKTDDEKKDE